jgi:hypothetical protein
LILYDQNYNFIGISNETLSYLGYEDLADFTSQHSDFANLLANKEGYIYKFQNFSWIDFILYSGSPNKSALLKLKSGEELEIKLSVKEVHLTLPIGDSEKYYAVRILSDNFVNIASKTDASIAEKSPPKNSFNLNNLMGTAQPIEESTSSTTTPPPVLEEKQSNTETESDFILNFPSSEEIKEEESLLESIDLREKEELTPQLTDSENEEKFSINLSDSFLHTSQEEVSDELESSSSTLLKEESDFSLKLPTQADEESRLNLPQEEEENEISLNFLKESEREIKEDDITTLQENHDVSLDFLKTDKQDSFETGFKLKHVNASEDLPQKEQEQEQISLDFLKKEEHSPTETLESSSFLKIEEEEVSLTPPTTPSAEENGEETFVTNLKKEQIIAQIKSDIDEIDAVEEPQEYTSKQDTLVQERDSELSATLFNKNEVKKEKKSFTKTLKSLFHESHTLTDAQIEDELPLESSLEPEATLKVREKSEEKAFLALSALGLEKEEEDALLQEFIHDTKENISLLKSFLASSSLEQIEYLLIKMHSSADILNLNDIIDTLTQMKQSCKESDTNNVEILLEKLQMQVRTLSSYLEREAV